MTEMTKLADEGGKIDISMFHLLKNVEGNIHDEKRYERYKKDSNLTSRDEDNSI